MIWETLFLLLPISAASGWVYGYKSRQHKQSPRPNKLPQDYLTGLNYLINEQPDKAVDVFIRMLEVDSQTVETHLALGSLFRRRGEVARATRVHQNLIARPQLDERQRMQALMELARDYLSAGVLDRAEQLFRQLISDREFGFASMYALIDIYQQQKDWHKAIEIAHRIADNGDRQILTAMGHYYCILAEKARETGQQDTARRYLKKALNNDKFSVRANILSACMELDNDRPKNAIKLLDKIKNQDPDFISITLGYICQAYEKLNDIDGLIDTLHNYLEQYPRASTLILLTDYVARYQGNKEAMQLLARLIKQYPSLKGLNQLIDLYIVYAQDGSRDKLIILRDLTDQLIENKPSYRCQQCGFSGQVFYWLCPSCKSWNTVKPIQGLEGD